MALYFLAILLVGTFLIIIYNLRKNKHNPPLPPTPPSLPIIGHLHLLKDPYHRTFHALSAAYGPIFHLKLGTRHVVVVSSPQAAEECFTGSNDVVLANRPDFLVAKLLGYDRTALVWTPYGDHWRNIRRLTNLEVFSTSRVQQLAKIRVDEARSLTRRIVRSSYNSKSGGRGGAEGADGWVEMELERELLQLTWNVVVRTVGLEESGLVGRPVDELFRTVKLMSVLDFFPVLGRIVGRFGCKVLAERKMVETEKNRDRFLQGLVDEFKKKKRSSSPCGGGGKGEEDDDEKENNKTTMMEQLMTLQKTDPNYYTDDVIKGIILTMFTAGTDTSSRTMEWAMSLLLNNPSIFQRAREEIDSQTITTTCHNNNKTRLVEDSDLPNLPYLRCIIHETLRLFPAAPTLLPHSSSSDTTLGGYRIPRGAVVFVNAWAIHRDPSVWKDPLEFRPERFVEEERDQSRSDIRGFKFIPFGGGRRACPGSNMAMRTMSITLATLIQCFDWEKVKSGEPISLDEGITGGTVVMPKSEPLRVVCKPRLCMAEVLSEL